MDKIVIKVAGILYAGEHHSDHLYVENFAPKDGKEYAMRVRATDGNVYIAEFKDGKTLIEQCFIPMAGHLNVELCEKIGEEYISLSAVFMFPVFESIDETEDTPPPYEQAKSLAERAIEAADRAEDIANSIGTGGGTGTPGKDGKSAYEIAVDNGFEGTEAEWLESLKGKDGELVTSEQIENAVDNYLNKNPIEVDIPDSLPNPNALTFTGAVSATYNGSAPVTVNIPSGGSGGASERWRPLKTIVIPEDVSADTTDITWFTDADNNVTGFLVDTDDNGNTVAIEDFKMFGIATNTGVNGNSIYVGESLDRLMHGYRCGATDDVAKFYDLSFNRLGNSAFPVMGYCSVYSPPMSYNSFFGNDPGYSDANNALKQAIGRFPEPLKSVCIMLDGAYFKSGKFYIFAKEQS